MDNIQNILTFLDVLIAQSTPEHPAWNIEHILEKKPPMWNYIDGAMLKAVLDIYYATGDKKYLDFVINFADFFISEDGKILNYKVEEYNCDNINPGKILFDLYQITKADKYKKAIELQMEQVKNHPRTGEGNFWHKQIYPNQVWLDGLYMMMPFYMQYEMLFNGKENYKDIINQIQNAYNKIKDPKTHLMYHGYDYSRASAWADKTTGLSPNFWTRSLGWYAMALLDTAEKLDEMFFYEYDLLQKYLKEILDALLVYQDEDSKLFYQVTDQGDRAGNYLETSGSCAIAYCLMKGSRLGFLPKDYFEKGYDIWQAVIDHKLVLTEDKFVLKDVCLVAGLGGMPGKGDYKDRDGTYEYYISEPRVDNDAKGVAPFLFATAEVLRAKR